MFLLSRWDFYREKVREENERKREKEQKEQIMAFWSRLIKGHQVMETAFEEFSERKEKWIEGLQKHFRVKRMQRFFRRAILRKGEYKNMRLSHTLR